MTENISVVPGTGGWEEDGLKSTWEHLEQGGTILYLSCGRAYTTIYICQNTQNFALKSVNFTARKLLLIKKWKKIKGLKTTL